LFEIEDATNSDSDSETYDAREDDALDSLEASLKV
jgi:hypothetical protein